MATTTNPATLSAGQASRDWLRIVSITLTIIGLLITIYLVWAHVSNTETVCPQTATFNCDLVQNSVYSKIGPLPIVYLGLAGYIAILAALLLETRIPILVSRGKLIVFAMTLFGILFSGYLTAIEAFVLHSWCVWCVGSAITMTVLFVVSFARLWQSFNAPDLDEEDEE